jgi:uncharacterized protein YegL
MDYEGEFDRIPDLQEALEFADNPDPRTPCVLVLDTSASMEGAPIAQLNAGLRAFEQALQADALARRRVEVSVVTFGGQVQVQDFVGAEQWRAPTLEASGATPLGEALGRALDRVGWRKRVYAEMGVPHTRPWVFLITDGAPTDAWEEVAARVHRLSAQKHVALFAVAVEQANLQILGRIAAPERPPVRLAGLRFEELFVWLSNSLGQAASVGPGQAVALAPVRGWAQV